MYKKCICMCSFSINDFFGFWWIRTSTNRNKIPQIPPNPPLYVKYNRCRFCSKPEIFDGTSMLMTFHMDWSSVPLVPCGSLWLPTSPYSQVSKITQPCDEIPSNLLNLKHVVISVQPGRKFPYHLHPNNLVRIHSICSHRMTASKAPPCSFESISSSDTYPKFFVSQGLRTPVEWYIQASSKQLQWKPFPCWFMKRFCLKIRISKASKNRNLFIDYFYKKK